MRARAYVAVLLGLGLALQGAHGAEPAHEAARIIVAFANLTHGAPPPAGTTGSHYGGTQSYRVAPSARQQAHQLATSYALREVTSWPIQALAIHCVVYEVPVDRSVAELLTALQHDARVVLAQPLQEFHTLSDVGSAPSHYNDPLYDLQTNLTALGIARAHERSEGAGLKVALIDTAVDASHPDLQGRILATHSYVPARSGASPSQRHGTAMAGLIAAVANNHIGIVGIAPRAQLEVFEACWQLRSDSDAAVCNTFTLAQALAGALASGAPLVNLSIAGPSDPLLAALINHGLKRGVIFVGAAAPTGEGFPTDIPGVMAAAGREHALPLGALALPAEHVLTLRPAGEYDFESGNSVASAELTGIMALLLSAAPHGIASGRLLALLKGGGAGPDSGAIDVNSALEHLDAPPHRTRMALRAAP